MKTQIVEELPNAQTALHGYRDRDGLLTKIQRLLNLAQGNVYEEEAKTAVALAQRLMVANAIAMAEVEAHEGPKTEKKCTRVRAAEDLDAVLNLWQEFADFTFPAMIEQLIDALQEKL